jgi:hypothetical protein
MGRHLAILVGLAVLLAACGDRAGPSAEPEALRGTTAGVEWVILPYPQGASFALENAEYEDATAGDVRAALERVGAHLLASVGEDERARDVAKRLPSYCCQAVGFSRKGGRFLFLNFFLREEGEPHPDDAPDKPPFAPDDPPFDWKREALVVDDGGDAFWQVTYDPATGAFSDLTINGES